jgi:SAM-dependent methyltransferase
MYPLNVDRILQRIGPGDRVLDVGGWAQPFNRADAVLDLFPYETRGAYGSIGGGSEHFDKSSWYVHDINTRAPFPFADDEFDFVICSHTLEDIRDPIGVAREIERVGRSGYIETPSRRLESTMGAEGRGFAGWSHHRWLVERAGDELVFRFKSHLIHGSRRFHLPHSHLRTLTEEEKMTALFWEGSIGTVERLSIDRDVLARELESFVNRYDPPSRLDLILDSVSDPVQTWRNLTGRALPTAVLPEVELR